MYGILKAHKQPVQLRYIAGCSRKGAAILEKAKESEEVEKETEEEYIRRMTKEKKNSKHNSGQI